MSAAPIDTDIADTQDILALDKINAQTARNALEHEQKHRWSSLREETMLQLVSKFMTKSTSGVVKTYTDASVLDGQKLRAAIDEALKAAAD